MAGGRRGDLFLKLPELLTAVTHVRPPPVTIFSLSRSPQARKEGTSDGRRAKDTTLIVMPYGLANLDGTAHGVEKVSTLCLLLVVGLTWSGRWAPPK